MPTRSEASSRHPVFALYYPPWACVWRDQRGLAVGAPKQRTLTKVRTPTPPELISFRHEGFLGRIEKNFWSWKICRETSAGTSSDTWWANDEWYRMAWPKFKCSPLKRLISKRAEYRPNEPHLCFVALPWMPKKTRLSYFSRKKVISFSLFFCATNFNSFLKRKKLRRPVWQYFPIISDSDVKKELWLWEEDKKGFSSLSLSLSQTLSMVEPGCLERFLDGFSTKVEEAKS